MPTWFNELSAVNVNEHIKKKNGLNYLSWMWAWQELKKRYPLSYATVHETEEGMLVWKDPIGCHVKTSITIVWEENGETKNHTVTEYLPVMDFKNKSIPYENVDSMAVNKTIQRSLTKCIARLGLGSYIFVDEDLPEEEVIKNKIAEKEKTELDLLRQKCLDLATQKSSINKEMATSIWAKYVTGSIKKITDKEKLEKLAEELSAIKKE